MSLHDSTDHDPYEQARMESAGAERDDHQATLNFAGEPDPAPMMSAREAMVCAIACAQIDDAPGGRLWLDIARELRQGEWMSASVKGVELAPGGPITGETTREWIAKQIRMKKYPRLLPTDDDADQIVDYRRGQDAPPSAKATSYARARVRALDAGMGIHHVDERTLLDEILQRADGDTQVMQVPTPRTRAEPSPTRDTECEHCILDVQWIDGMGFAHDVPGRIVACPMDMAYRR